MSEIKAVKHETNDWDDLIPSGQGIPAKLFRCGYCRTYYIITGKNLMTHIDYMRALGWGHTRVYGWICRECNPPTFLGDTP